jgi:LuxR family transcriptional regulator, maltose regulon positive regulatory protein
MNLSLTGGAPAVARGDYAAVLAGPRLVQNNPQEATATRMTVRDRADLVFPLALAVAAMLLEAAARDEPMLGGVADVLDEESRRPPPPPRDRPAWSVERLTQSEARVLRYLPTHMSAPEIAAELCLSTHTVRTHVQHVYRKLGAHSRHEAVRRASAIGLFAGSGSAPRQGAREPVRART